MDTGLYTRSYFRVLRVSNSENRIYIMSKYLAIRFCFVNFGD
jgi:hypothetical protein